MTTKGHPLLGKWQITDIKLWDAEFIDLLGPGSIQFDPDGGGEFACGAVQGGLDCHFGTDSIHFNCEASDDIDHARRDHDADLEQDGTITREIPFHRGDQSTLTARRP